MPASSKIGAFLFFLVLFPTTVFVVYEVQSLREKEAMLTAIYDRQLDALLFAVNQHAWDVADAWAGQVTRMLENQPSDAPRTTPLADFVAARPALAALYLADSLLQRPLRLAPNDDAPPPAPLTLAPALARRLAQRRQQGFRQLEPVVLDSTTTPTRLALAFATGHPDPNTTLAALEIDADRFIRQVLGPKLTEVAGDRFAVGCFPTTGGAPVYGTTDQPLAEMQQQRTLWLFPDYVLGIRAQGETISEVMRGRLYRNLAIVLVGAGVLLAGVFFFYRTLGRELRLAQMKSDFVSNVSHELRTPLALIRMFAETLALGRVKTEEKKAEYYHIIGQETERLTHLVNNILNFARIEAGQKAYERTPAALNAIVEDLMHAYTYRLRSEGFTTEVALTPDLPPIEADTDAIAEALLNLIENAIKYSSRRKHLTIRTGQRPDAVFAEVQDQGIGISDAEQARIFDKFYRVSTGLVHDVKGTGLGLSLVQHILQAHGGHVEVESQLGQGSTFRLVFPLASTPAETPA